MAAPKEIKEKVRKLRETIEKYRRLYHELDTPEISDEAYDSLVQELVSYEKKYPEIRSQGSPSEKIGGEPLKEFKKVRHKMRQWSFDNVFTNEEFILWEQKTRRFLEKEITFPEEVSYSAEHKIDGLKIILEYQNGKFVQGATRGNGIEGEDITQNLKMIKSIPFVLKYPIDITVVGEAWLSHGEFERINRKREKKNESLFANTRNAAAGSLRQLDPTIVAERKLDSYIYDIDFLDVRKESIDTPKTQKEELELLRELGFVVNQHFRVCKNVEEVFSYYMSWLKKRHNLPYEFDGVAVKVNNISLQQALGYTAKAPRFAVAYKFPAEQVTTTVEDIVLQVGRTGVLTPVAHLKPILVSGSVISRATLHNEDEIKRLDVRIGDTVIIQKAGDVIPDIVSVMTELRSGKEKIFRFPTHMAECGGDGSIERVPGQAAYRCVSFDSFELQKRKFQYFVSKVAFNIEGLGSQIIERLMEEGLVASFDDIFTLTKGDIIQLPGFKEKSADNLLSAIENAREVALPQFLIGLSIDQVGEETAHDLAQHFGSLEKLQRATLLELEAVSGIGGVVARSLYTWFKNTDNKKLLKRLLKVVSIQKSRSTGEGKLSGKTFVLTGSLSTLTRDDAQSKIRQLGGSISSSVSKQTDFVVAGENPGTKYQKAKEFEIQILSEKEFIALVEG